MLYVLPSLGKTIFAHSLKLPFQRVVLHGLAADVEFAFRHRFEDYANIHLKDVRFWQKRSPLFTQQLHTPQHLPLARYILGTSFLTHSLQ